MFKPYYTATMQPVQHGDVVHFGNRAWTVESTQESDRFLETGLWVRSMDESHYMVRISGTQVGIQFFQTK